MAQPFYKAFYKDSHALIIGIDKYKFASPLAFAVNDAKGVAAALETEFDFPSANITLLTDTKATRKAITAAYMSYAGSDKVGPEDRLLVFFAGHGHTAPSRRGETGFLVPVDGNIEDLSTLVKWTELTGSADLIAAKHVFFLMDACYGGLAVTRKIIPAGSMRLLQDMLQRFSRQVLTAGKADQTVSDGGGVRPGHSIFTSHVLDALEGAASATEGVVTANGVMAYVYDKVGSDPLSNQTPHYGSIEGDGDFVFSPWLKEESASPTGEQTLVQTPAFSEETPLSPNDSPTELLKRLIADPADKIRLDEFVTRRVRRAAQELTVDKFPTQGNYSKEEFLGRIKIYETITLDLQEAIILLARWGSNDQLPLIQKIMSRLSEANDARGGLVAWIALKWYPLLLLMYAGGIAALSERRFDVLRAVLFAPVHDEDARTRSVIFPTIDAMTDMHDNFKAVPGLERRHTPRSDHIFQTLQPILEDNLFLGKSYDSLFDEFEIFLALAYASEMDEDHHFWGPVGRFGWKRRYGSNPYQSFVSEAQNEGARWPALRAGFFGGNQEKFKAVADEYAELLGKMRWY